MNLKLASFEEIVKNSTILLQFYHSVRTDNELDWEHRRYNGSPIRVTPFGWHKYCVALQCSTCHLFNTRNVMWRCFVSHEALRFLTLLQCHFKFQLIRFDECTQTERKPKKKRTYILTDFKDHTMIKSLKGNCLEYCKVYWNAQYVWIKYLHFGHYVL